MKIILAIALIFLLNACSSEVDKCVDAEVKSWKSHNERIEADVAAGRKKYSTEAGKSAYGFIFDESVVVKDERTKAEVEADARRRCLLLAKK